VPPDRRTVEAWWRSPLASIVLVMSGLAVVFWEVGQGESATAYGYSAGVALVGLGVTGRIQSWAVRNDNEKPDG